MRAVPVIVHELIEPDAVRAFYLEQAHLLETYGLSHCAECESSACRKAYELVQFGVLVEGLHYTSKEAADE